ncbi:MAG: hypothetical protein ACRCZS_01715 [Chroococcidiopsis sp.]
MELTKVTYSRSKQVSANESECVEVSSDIDEQEDASEVLAYLQNWVETKLKIRETVAQLDARRFELQNEIYRLENNVQVARGKWQTAQEFLKLHGVENTLDDIPF